MRNVIVCCISMVSLAAFAQTGKRVSPWQKEIDEAQKEIKREKDEVTCPARLTLRVKDTTGAVVPNASTWVSIASRYGKERVPVTGKTDTNGLFSVEQECADEGVRFAVTKEGYYETGREFWFDGVEQIKGRRGKSWAPWDPVIDVVLKEVRKPAAMAVLWNKPLVFPQNQKVGFDCEKGDLLPPFGNGEHEDFTFFFTSKAKPDGRTLADKSFYTNKLVLATDKDGGFIEHKRDKFSTFWSVYDAPETGYQNTLVYEVEWSGATATKNKQFDVDNDYLIFKARIKRDEKGNIISANYGKIYSLTCGEGTRPWGTKGGVSLQCYFNPTPNDRNLEADPLKNLSPFVPRSRGDNIGFEP